MSKFQSLAKSLSSTRTHTFFSQMLFDKEIIINNNNINNNSNFYSTIFIAVQKGLKTCLKVIEN